MFLAVGGEPERHDQAVLAHVHVIELDSREVERVRLVPIATRPDARALATKCCSRRFCSSHGLPMVDGIGSRRIPMQISQCVRVRGARWRIVDFRLYPDCQLVTPAGTSPTHGVQRQVLAPFDDIEPLAHNHRNEAGEPIPSLPRGGIVAQGPGKHIVGVTALGYTRGRSERTATNDSGVSISIR